MAVVVSGGRPRHVAARYPFADPSRAPTHAGTRRSIDLLRDGLSVTFEGIVRSQPWVFAAVSRLSFWTARIPLKLYDGELSDSRQRVYDGELARLLKRPHRGVRQSGFMLEFAWDYYTHGHGLAVKFRATPGEPPNELWNVPWRFVEPLVDETGRVMAYEVKIGGERWVLPPTQVVHAQWPRGIAPLEALVRTVQAEDAAASYLVETLEQGVLPRAAFSTTDKISSDKDMQRLRQELDKLYGGGSGTFAILHSGVTYDKAIGVSPKDMGLDGLRKYGREETAAAFDVTPPFLGILDRATFTNISELREANYQDSLGPKLEQLQGCFQGQLIDVETVWDALEYYVEYDMGAILKPNPEGQARQALMEQQSSTTSIDERRRRFNLPAIGIEGVTDVPLIPVNMVPAGAPCDPAGDGDGALGDALTAAAFQYGRPAAPATPPPDSDDDG